MAKCEVELLDDGGWQWRVDDRWVSAPLLISSLGISPGERVEITRRNTELEAAAREVIAWNHLGESSKTLEEICAEIVAALPAEPAPTTPALETVECRPGVAKIFRDLIAEIGGGK